MLAVSWELLISVVVRAAPLKSTTEDDTKWLPAAVRTKLGCNCAKSSVAGEIEVRDGTWAGAPAERIQSVAPRQDQEHDEQRNDEHDPNRRQHELSVAYANGKQAVAARFSAQTGQSPVTGAGDKVQGMSSISAMQAAGHDQQNGTGSIVPALAKNARTGQPLIPEREGKSRRAGHPSNRGRRYMQELRNILSWLFERSLLKTWDRRDVPRFLFSVAGFSEKTGERPVSLSFGKPRGQNVGTDGTYPDFCSPSLVFQKKPVNVPSVP